MKNIIQIFLALTVSLSYSQEADTVKKLHQNFKKTIFKNPDSAFHYVKRIKALKKKSKNYLPAYFYHQDLGQYYFFMGQLDSSEFHYKKAYDIGFSAGIDTLTIDSNIWLANHEYFKGEMTKCSLRYRVILEHSKKVNYLEGITSAHAMFASGERDLSKKMDLYLKIDSLYGAHQTQSSLLARTYAAIAGIYLEAKGNNELANDYIRKCIEVSKKVDYPPGEYEANRLLIKRSLQDEDYDNTIRLYNELLSQGIAYNDPTAKDVATLGLAKMYFEKGELAQTEAQLKIGGYLLELPKGAPLLGQVHLLWAELYIALGNQEKALHHLKEARVNPDLTDEFDFSIELHKVEAKYYEAIGDFTNAYQIKKKYDEQVDFLNEQRNTNGFILNEQLKLKEKNKQEISLLKAQNELAEQQKRSQRNLLLSGIGITTLALLFLFFLYRNRQKTNTRLREIDALKTNFFTNISHEFRTPLTLISSPIQEFLETTNVSSEKRKHFEIAQKNTKRLTVLVDQLLELSKIDSGHRKLLLQKNAPTQMIAAWSESFSYLAQQKKIDFKTTISHREAKFWLDREALENMVVNLLGNAIKYTPEQGKIHVQASIQDAMLHLSIKNSGSGLSKVEMKTIFNRFYQTDGQKEGAGVGLSLVKELAELHGGNINVTSELDKWTLFTLQLCLDKTKLKNVEIITEADSPPSVVLPIPKLAAAKEDLEIGDSELPILLIVEDNDDVRTLLIDSFKKEYEIVAAINGEDGIVKALERIPDIIISDLMMPIKDGIALTKTLKTDERTSHIPIILLTAKAGDENELKGIEIGADDYIIKPFNQKILKSKTASLVALRKKLQSRYSQEVILKPKDIAISSMDEKFLDRVQRTLDEKLIESSFTIKEFSMAMHMSRMQLHRKLKALTGLSASEFIKSQRLKLAAQILKSTDINISEVGYSVGFNDHAYFSKCFKEAYNCTPSEYAEEKRTS